MALRLLAINRSSTCSRSTLTLSSADSNHGLTAVQSALQALKFQLHHGGTGIHMLHRAVVKRTEKLLTMHRCDCSQQDKSATAVMPILPLLCTSLKLLNLCVLSQAFLGQMRMEVVFHPMQCNCQCHMDAAAQNPASGVLHAHLPWIKPRPAPQRCISSRMTLLVQAGLLEGP